MNRLDKKAPRADKRKAKIVILILLILFAVLLLFNLILDVGLDSLFSSQEGEATREPVFLFNPDYDYDIFEDEEYLDLDRYISYSPDGGITFSTLIDDRAFEQAGPTAIFFRRYFDAVIHGNHEAYNALFTEEYRKEHGDKERFTMQMLYNMEVIRLREEDVYDEENGMNYTLYEYEVRYAIRRNNGTFRDDLPSNRTRPQIFILVRDDATDRILIRSISEYQSR